MLARWRAGGHGQQVQVVVAEQGLDAAAAGFRQRLHAPQGQQRFRATVDQVADEEDARIVALPAIERDLLEQGFGFVGATLQVANDIGFHKISMPGDGVSWGAY